ncbi:MAG: MoxR family ATPase, partial [Turicibacter sp.]|nr:MoxR family ATPase [Turicibacter sp.]
LIEDIPGVGKTSLVYAFAKSFNSSFKRIQFTPDILPSDVTGFSMYNHKNGEFEYRPGSIMANIVLADEINRTSPKTQSSLLEAMEEHQVTVDGTTYKVPKPFAVFATQNPADHIGTYPLPEAQLDRFFIRISLGYPTFEEELGMVGRFNGASPLETLKPVVSASTLLALQELAAKVHVSLEMMAYMVAIVRQTRNHPDIDLGCSPRGSLALYKAAQAWALYKGRAYVIPDDALKMAVPVLAHRLGLTQEARFKKVDPMKLMGHVASLVKIPK